MLETKTEIDVNAEFANSLTHGIGVLLGIIGVPVLMTLALRSGSLPALIGAGIYALSFLMVFTSSTLYHCCFRADVKRMLRILDHISIYFLIAGTYTPFILIYMNNTMGAVLLSLQWGLTLFGIFFKIYRINKFKKLSLTIYLTMGWMIAGFGKMCYETVPGSVMILVLAGGLCYTIGVIFYVREKWNYNHAVWHIFVLFGGISHFAAVGLALS